MTRRYTVEYDSVVVKRRRSIREHVFAKVKTCDRFFLDFIYPCDILNCIFNCQ